MPYVMKIANRILTCMTSNLYNREHATRQTPVITNFYNGKIYVKKDTLV